MWNRLLVIGMLSTGLALADQRPGTLIDAHSHYTATDARSLSAADIIAKLDASGVSRVVITGTPGHLARELHAHAPGRVIPVLGVYESDADKGTWMMDRDLPARVADQLLRGGWAGIGELHLFARHAQSEVFAKLVRLADRHDLMLLLHGDPEIVDQAFAIAPRIRVLWAHLGTVPEPDEVTRVLQRHADKALWIDTSVRDERIAPQGQLLPAWREVFEAHPDRFVVAVDAFSTRRWGRYEEVVSHIRQWVGALPPSLQERLLWRNAEALFEPWLIQRP